MGDLKIFGGPTMEGFAKKVCDNLGLALGKVGWRYFADGERRPQFEESIRSCDVYIIQSTHQPDSNLVNLLLMLNAAKDASPQKITAVITYFGWGRQDKKVERRVPISAKLMAMLINTAGADDVMTMDLHNGSIQGFFDKAPDNLLAKPFFVDYLKNNLSEEVRRNLKILVPDSGAVDMGISYGKHLGLTADDIAVVIKMHGALDKKDMKSLSISGRVKDKYLVPIDDMVDTVKTLCDATSLAIDKYGALGIPLACATHAILSDDENGSAVSKIEKSPIEKLIVSDTIPLPFEKESYRIKVVSATDIFAKAIRISHEGGSISNLFI